jgi:RNA polymerase sigma factor (sigma-70 family)
LEPHHPDHPTVAIISTESMDDQAVTAPASAAEALFLEHLSALERIIAIVCARQGLTGADAEDFASTARMHLIEDDYAVLRKFGGRSSVTTFLSVVVANLARDYRVRRHGRWRTSAAARRLGPVAERLERLVYRDRMGLHEAFAVVRSEGATGSDRELAELFHRIPPRLPMRPEEAGEEPLSFVPSAERADAAVAADEERREREEIQVALARALDALPAEDRLILRMRFWDDMSVADIARGLDLPQKPLYRRIDRGLLRLKERLLGAGVAPERALSFVGEGEGEWDNGATDSSIGKR